MARRKKQHTGAMSAADLEMFEEHLRQHPPRAKTVRGNPSAARSRKSLNALAKSGAVVVDYSLDLHGRTLDEAWRFVEHALTRAAAEGWGILRIITGKGYRSEGGQGVLIQEIPERLRRDDRVAEIVQAVKPTDGGEGAWFVRLR